MPKPSKNNRYQNCGLSISAQLKNLYLISFDSQAKATPETEDLYLLTEEGPGEQNLIGDLPDYSLKPDHNNKQSYNFATSFFGVPDNKSLSAWFIYLLLGGFVFTPLKNLAKLFIEFLPGILSLLCLNIEYMMLNNESPKKSLSSYFAAIALEIMWGITELTNLAWTLIRTITSPLSSYKTAGDKFSSGLSILCTITGAIAIGAAIASLFLTGPAIVLIPALASVSPILLNVWLGTISAIGFYGITAVHNKFNTSNNGSHYERLPLNADNQSGSDIVKSNLNIPLSYATANGDTDELPEVYCPNISSMDTTREDPTNSL